MSYDIKTIRADFPISSREVNGQSLVYLDNGGCCQTNANSSLLGQHTCRKCHESLKYQTAN